MIRLAFQLGTVSIETLHFTDPWTTPFEDHLKRASVILATAGRDGQGIQDTVAAAQVQDEAATSPLGKVEFVCLNHVREADRQTAREGGWEGRRGGDRDKQKQTHDLAFWLGRCIFQWRLHIPESRPHDCRDQGGVREREQPLLGWNHRLDLMR